MKTPDDEISAPAADVAAPDEVLFEILENSDYCCVCAPAHLARRVRVQTAERLQRETAGMRRQATGVVGLDLAVIDDRMTLEQWYEQLLLQLAPQLGLTERLQAFWQAAEKLSPLQRWMAALQEIVLPQRPGRLVIFVEGIDAVQRLPFSADELLSAIRECYNRRAQEPEFQRLTFCLLSAAPLVSLIRDPRTTWFNIGRRLELTEAGKSRAAPKPPGGSQDRRERPSLLKRAFDWILAEPYCCAALAITARPAAFP